MIFSRTNKAQVVYMIKRSLTDNKFVHAGSSQMSHIPAKDDFVLLANSYFRVESRIWDMKESKVVLFLLPTVIVA